MPAKKKQNAKNGFSCYMQEIMQSLRREGRVFPNGMSDVVHIALPRWKALSDGERDKYERQAKETKKREQRQQNDKRYDNVGNLIANRIDPVAEEAKRRIKERKIAKSRWPPGKEIMTEKFYFISMEFLCRTEEGHYLPCEIGLVEWSMISGITKTFHKFIDPGPIPLGYRHTCQSHSDDSHQIPLERFELATDDYSFLWMQMKNFINPNGEKHEYPPVYCMAKDMKCVEYCMGWIYNNSCRGPEPNVLHKIYYIEDFVVDIYSHCGAAIAESEGVTLLETSSFDYEPNSTCSWHEEKGIKYCALGNSKRYAYALSDGMSILEGYEFELTPSHVPTRTDAELNRFQTLPSSAIHVDPVPYKPRRHRDFGSSRSREFQGEGYGAKGFASTDFRERRAPSSCGGISEPEATECPTLSVGGVAAGDAQQYEENFGATVSLDIIKKSATASQNNPSASPWVRAATSKSQTSCSNEEFPTLTDDDFPSLGGSANKPKYAGRSGPPPPTDLPKPDSWQGNKVRNQPYQSPQGFCQATPAGVAKPPPPGLGRGLGRGRGAPVHAGGGNWDPQPGRPSLTASTMSNSPPQPPSRSSVPVWQQAAMKQTQAQQAPPPQTETTNRPTWQVAAENKPAQSGASNVPSSDNRPTLQQAVQQNPWGQTSSANSRPASQQTVQPSPWGQAPGRGGPGASQIVRPVGRGRGRGTMNLTQDMATMDIYQ